MDIEHFSNWRTAVFFHAALRFQVRLEIAVHEYASIEAALNHIEDRLGVTFMHWE
jgi:hypothetical protein